jgi:hypothetical protein
MRSNLIIIVCLVFAAIAYSSGKKDAGPSISAPSYQSFIGKKFVEIDEIDSMLSSSQFGSIYENENFGVTIYGHNGFLDKSRNSRYWYIFFSKHVGYQGQKAIRQILDIVTIDMNNFSDTSRIWLDECTCKKQKACNTIAIYYHDEKMADKEILVKPLKVWRPNIATGKIEEISPESVRCGSQAPEEESP